MQITRIHRRTLVDFSLSPAQRDLQTRVRVFIRSQIVPLEVARASKRTSHGPSRELRDELVELGKHHRVHTSCLHLDTMQTKGVVLEEAGYSLLGPIALNVQAPDEGNAHLMEAIGTEGQKEIFLEKLKSGEYTSCFCMTEPAPGAGSDPRALKTMAKRDSKGDFLVSGDKWLITGADEADFCIVMAVVEDNVGPTMFLCKMDAPGIKLARTLHTMDSSFFGGHSCVEFRDVLIKKENVLGELGKGLEYAQIRLAPARLTHCMRWLGAATRCQDEAKKHAISRDSFKKKLIDHQGVSFQLADNEIDLHASRLMIQHCAWMLDRANTTVDHSKARLESSICKVFVSEALYRVADRSLQILGGLGVTNDVEVSRVFLDLRAFRIYDGASEVHRMSIGRSLKFV